MYIYIWDDKEQSKVTILCFKDNDHKYNKNRKAIQNSKKLDCPAKVVIKEVLAFSDKEVKI